MQDQIGKTIRLTTTDPSDIDSIIDFEGLNKKFVCSYDKQKHLALLVNNDCLHLSVRRLDNDQLIGHIILFGITGQDRSLEFRRIAINEKGQGFGRESLQILKKLCFKELNCHRLWLDVYDDNIRAIKLYESEGFIKEGILRENTKTEKGFRSQRIYSMLQDEYRNR